MCNWAWRGPEWLRPAVGGVLLGLVLLVLPEMYGTGYPVLEKAAKGGYATRFLLLLLAGKVLATSLTLAIGGWAACSRRGCSSEPYSVPPTEPP